MDTYTDELLRIAHVKKSIIVLSRKFSLLCGDVIDRKISNCLLIKVNKKIKEREWLLDYLFTLLEIRHGH